MDHYVLCTSWNRYPRLFEPGSVLILWLQTVFCVLTECIRIAPIAQPRIEIQLTALILRW